MGIQIGDVVPNLVLPDQNGAMRLLADLIGEKGLVLYFYPKDNTPGCTLEAQAFQALLPKFLSLGYPVVGVSRDTSASHAKFCGKFALGFTLLSDAGEKLCQAFDVLKEKNMCGKLCVGVVRSTFVVNHQGVLTKIYANVKAAGHAEQVLQELSGV